MYHHDSRDYAEAASEAAAKGRAKLQEIIHKGVSGATAVIERVQGQLVTDKVVRATAQHLSFPDGSPTLLAGGVDVPLHPNAFDQLLESAGVGKSLYNAMSKEAGGEMWGKNAVAHVVNEVLHHRTKQRNLVREAGGKAMAYLSDKFRRLDSRPLMDAFIGACQKLGLVPVDGVASDTKCRLRAVMPKVFEPVPNEVMAFGAEFGNSDFGDGGMVVNLFSLRVWCTNLAVSEKCLRQVHLGGRLPDDIELSARTYEADTKATALVVGDVVKSVIGPPRINKMLEAVKAANEKEIKSMDGIDKLLSKDFTKTDIQRVKAAFEGPDVVNLPPGNTVYRLSNALSWIAQGAGYTADERIKFQDAAGKLVAGDSKAKEV